MLWYQFCTIIPNFVEIRQTFRKTYSEVLISNLFFCMGLPFTICWCDHITPALRQLHWLPVRQRIVFKIAGLVHQSLVGTAPAYLARDCCLLSDVGRRPLRSNSNDMRKLLVPRTHNKLGDSSFSAAGPRLWNDLPPGLRRLGLTFDSFRQSLKSHLFGDRSA